MKQKIPAILLFLSVLTVLIFFKSKVPLVVNADDNLSGTLSGSLSGTLSGVLSGSVDVSAPSGGIKEGTNNWYKNGTRVRLTADELESDEQIYYRWQKGKPGEGGKYYSEEWKRYVNPIQARSGKNTLHYKIRDDEGNGSRENSTYLKVLDKKRIEGISVKIEDNYPLISWRLNSPNISYVRVYRGLTRDFVPSAENKLGTNMYWDTDYHDKTAVLGTTYFYKLVGFNPSEKQIVNRTVQVTIGY